MIRDRERSSRGAREAPIPARQLLAFAHVLADASAKAILPHFRRPISVGDKSGGLAFDPVTAADQAAEQVMARLVAGRWPEHGFVGEEAGRQGGESRYSWVIDPIDGTRAFIMGLPVWGTLIGILDQDVPVAGLMNQPFTGERFWAAEGVSRMRLGTRRARGLVSRTCPRLEDAILSTTHPGLFESGEESEAFARLSARVRMTRFGGDCYAYCLLAAGFIDLVVESGLKPYDVVALIPIVEGAGGRLTAWDGGPASGGGRIIAAGDPALHEAALRVLNG